MQSIFTYLISATSKSDSTNFATVVNSSPTTPVYLKSGVTYTGGAIEKANISVIGGDGTIVPADAVTKANGTTVLNGGTYTGTPAFSGSGNGNDIVVNIENGYFASDVHCGSITGNADGTVTAAISGGKFSAKLFGGGRISAAKTSITICDAADVVQDVCGGALVSDSTVTVNLDESRLTITGGKISRYVVGGSRVTSTGNTHIIGTTNLTISGGTFTLNFSSTENGAAILAGAFAVGNKTTLSKPQVQITESNTTVSTDITGAVYGGGFASQSGWVKVESANVEVTSGKVDRVFGGGWAQTGGTSEVGTAKVTVSGTAKVDFIYGGGGSSSPGNTLVGNVTITISENASVDYIFMGGRHANSVVNGTVDVIWASANTDTVTRITGKNGNGTKPEGSGSRRVTFVESCTVANIDAIDVITIHGNKKLTITTAVEGLRKINLITDFVTLPWTVISGADLSGIVSVVFAVNGQEVAVTWNADNTVGVLGDTGYTLNVSGNVLTLNK